MINQNVPFFLVLYVLVKIVGFLGKVVDIGDIGLLLAKADYKNVCRCKKAKPEIIYAEAVEHAIDYEVTCYIGFFPK